VVFMLGVIDGGQELKVPGCAADVFWWRGARADDAERIEPLGVGFGNGFDADVMAPTVAKVVFVEKLVNRITESCVERVMNCLRSQRVI